MNKLQTFQGALAFTGSSMLAGAVIHHRLSVWWALLIVAWALTVGAVAFMQGWESRR